MAILVCGIHHKTAPLALRERVAFSLEKLPLYLADLSAQENLTEAVILSTCNRSELYCEAEDPEVLLAWYARQHNISPAELAPHWYVHRDHAALVHIMRVASGLDSMVLGESQILGQMKNAYSESCAAGVVGPLFNRLFQQVFAIAKEVRSTTAVGACPVSVASAAVALSKNILPDLSKTNIVMIGAGSTIELVLRHLKGVGQVTIANRSRENAEVLAATHGARAISFTELDAALLDADLVFSATGSTVPVITVDRLAPLLKQRDSKPLVMIDLAVPRDIEPAVLDFTQVHLYCIDDLKGIIQQNLRGREHAAEKALEVIIARSDDFMLWLHSYDKVATTIRIYRSQIEDICRHELAKANRQLQKGEDPTRVLTSFAHAFTNKLLHTPSVQLRQAGLEGRHDILELAQQLFAVPPIG